MFAAMGLMTCPNLAVPAEVMRHVVEVESGTNPFAIGVVGGRLQRQPENLAEALATVHMLDAKGYDYSLGLAQVNRANFGKYGLDSYEKAFDACTNLAVGAQILAACYASSGNDWGKAFSCYYSGNFTTGFRDGYVRKVFDAIGRSQSASVDASNAIPIVPSNDPVASHRQGRTAPTPDQPGYRVALRSVAFHTTTTSAVSAPGSPPTPAVPAHGNATENPIAAVVTPGPVKVDQLGEPPSAAPFVPQVSGPGDAMTQRNVPRPPPTVASAVPDTTATSTPQPPPHDQAFVF